VRERGRQGEREREHAWRMLCVCVCVCACVYVYVYVCMYIYIYIYILQYINYMHACMLACILMDPIYIILYTHTPHIHYKALGVSIRFGKLRYRVSKPVTGGGGGAR
jgi:hypothetical protein